MSDSKSDLPQDLAVYPRDPSSALTPARRIALGVTAAWLALCLLFWIAVPAGEALSGLERVVVLSAVLIPILLVWMGALFIGSARAIHEDSRLLRASLDSMRQVHVAQAQMAATAMGPNVERKLDEIVKGQRAAETALAKFATQRKPSRPPTPVEAVADPPKPPESQPALDLSTPDDAAATVSNADFIVALNFPETADDTEGFAALRRALADPRAARLVQASQDTLTLLSQDGIYMDDLTPDRARPEIWRRFAEGERGRTVAALGGVRDRASLALAANRMRQDPVFRDTAHHFVRTFDQTFARFAEDASDTDIIKLTDTRTARAFMLLGRCAGLFD